jgi:hypothetical protein
MRSKFQERKISGNNHSDWGQFFILQEIVNYVINSLLNNYA